MNINMNGLAAVVGVVALVVLLYLKSDKVRGWIDALFE